MSELNELLKKRNASGSEIILWNVGRSKYAGQGIVAERNINAGELIFNDFPIVVGPRTSGQLTACVGCFDVRKPVKLCEKKCHLPVCSLECGNSPKHEKECKMFRKLKMEDDSWSNVLYKSLAPLRCLFLSENERSIVKMLHANSSNSVQKYVNVVKGIVGSLLSEEDIWWIRHCFGVLHGTAYEVELNGKASFSVQGLYPLAAMMNHHCSPNTRHYYGSEDPFKMYVVASKSIQKGEEITSHYCPLLWTTNARRIFLDVTKEFLCTCERCRDPREFGSYLSAVLCKCKGPILPMSPLVFSADWKCDSCSRIVTALDVAIVQTTAEKVPEAQIKSLLHPNNMFRVSRKMQTINRFSENLEALSFDNLKLLKQLIDEVLAIIDQLKLGDTRTKGILSLKLFKTLKEQKKRNMPVDSESIKRSYSKAKEILENDYTAPKVE